MSQKCQKETPRRAFDHLVGSGERPMRSTEEHALNKPVSTDHSDGE
jgi:hypothetical protein